VKGYNAPERVSEGMVRWRGLLWCSCKARKENVCWRSGKQIAPGDTVYRPITNGGSRMRRVLTSEWDRP
jgi:hypothetical protein